MTTYKPSLAMEKARPSIDTLITDEEYLGISSEMFKDGYRSPNRYEMGAYYFLGSDSYRKLTAYCFEFACLEANYLRMPPQGQPFAELNQQVRQAMFQNIITVIGGLKKKETASIALLSKREMLMAIMAKHNKQVQA